LLEKKRTEGLEKPAACTLRRNRKKRESGRQPEGVGEEKHGCCADCERGQSEELIIRLSTFRCGDVAKEKGRSHQEKRRVPSQKRIWGHLSRGQLGCLLRKKKPGHELAGGRVMEEGNGMNNPRKETTAHYHIGRQCSPGERKVSVRERKWKEKGGRPGGRGKNTGTVWHASRGDLSSENWELILPKGAEMMTKGKGAGEKGENLKERRKR